MMANYMSFDSNSAFNDRIRNHALLELRENLIPKHDEKKISPALIKLNRIVKRRENI